MEGVYFIVWLRKFSLTRWYLSKDLNQVRLWAVHVSDGVQKPCGRSRLTCLLRILYAGQNATVTTGQGTTDWFQTRKGICQGCILSPCLFNLYAEYITQNAGVLESQAGIKIAGRNINNLRYADDTTLMAGTEEPINESERGEWKSWLKIQHSKS